VCVCVCVCGVCWDGELRPKGRNQIMYLVVMGWPGQLEIYYFVNCFGDTNVSALLGSETWRSLLIPSAINLSDQVTPSQIPRGCILHTGWGGFTLWKLTSLCWTDEWVPFVRKINLSMLRLSRLCLISLFVPSLNPGQLPGIVSALRSLLIASLNEILGHVNLGR